MPRTCSLSLITLLFFFACKKNQNPDPTPPPPPQPLAPTVYVAGDSFDQSSQYAPYPIYWKNGVPVHLPHAGRSNATGIAVSGNDVYVSSSGIYLGNNVTYWKNQLAFNLADPSLITPTARGITTSGSDVYAVGGAYINGYQQFVPVYWKNQEPAVKLTLYPNASGDGRGIAVNGSDIYIAGTTYDPASGFGASPPCYWKNGTPTFLFAATSTSRNGRANAIFVSGPDIHVVGEIYTTGSSTGFACYWKNGVVTELAPSALGQWSQANSVTIVGNDVYIAGAVSGTDNNLHATYWKNGVPVTLDNTYSIAKGIAVYQNDVYVVGDRGVDKAVLWKNGVPLLLGRGRANAVVVR